MKNHNFISVIVLTSILVIVVSLFVIYPRGINEESIRLMIRWTAKSSATFFAIAFGVSSIHFLIKNGVTRTLLQYRPHIGLAFATFHSFHLFFLLWLQNSIHPVFTLAKTTSLAGGGLAYIFMYLMVLTTFPKVKAKISVKQWKLLHIIGGYWIWVIFFKSYFRKVSRHDQGYFLCILLAIVFIARVIHLFFRKKKLKMNS
jgi:hypothetical protein